MKKGAVATIMNLVPNFCLFSYRDCTLFGNQRFLKKSCESVLTLSHPAEIPGAEQSDTLS